MINIESYSELPQPVQAMAKNFFEAYVKEPNVYEVTPDEYDHLAKTDDVVTQLLFWRTAHKFYAVLAGDAKRKVQSQIIQHDPYYVPCSILAFYEIEEHLLPAWKRKYSNKSMTEHVLEMGI